MHVTSSTHDKQNPSILLEAGTVLQPRLVPPILLKAVLRTRIDNPQSSVSGELAPFPTLPIASNIQLFLIISTTKNSFLLSLKRQISVTWWLKSRGPLTWVKAVDCPFGLQLDAGCQVVPVHNSECATPSVGDPQKEHGSVQVLQTRIISTASWRRKYETPYQRWDMEHKHPVLSLNAKGWFACSILNN